MTGKLAIDVYQTPTHVIIIAPIAGIHTDDIDIKIENDVLTITGHRDHITKGIKPDDYLANECYWGEFSRSIILPNALDTDNLHANFKQGILTIEIPKKERGEQTIAMN